MNHWKPYLCKKWSLWSTEVPVKLYLDKLLKDCRKVSVDLALLLRSRQVEGAACRCRSSCGG